MPDEFENPFIDASNEAFIGDLADGIVLKQIWALRL
jgi:hypothetical protein